MAVRYCLCCLCNLSVTGGYRGDENTDVTASTEIVPVMCLQGPSFLEMSESAGPQTGVMGYSLSSILLGSAIATTMSVSQNFPKDVCLGLCFLKYWHFPVVSKLNPWAPSLYWLCHFISAMVAGGPWASPHSTFSQTLWLPKERYAGVFLRSYGPTNARNRSLAEFSPSISKGNVKKQEGFSSSPVAVFDPPHHTICV